MALEFRGATYWFVMYRYPNGEGGGSSTWSGDSDQSFEDWVASEQLLSDGTTDVPDEAPAAGRASPTSTWSASSAPARRWSRRRA